MIGQEPETTAYWHKQGENLMYVKEVNDNNETVDYTFSGSGPVPGLFRETLRYNKTTGTLELLSPCDCLERGPAMVAASLAERGKLGDGPVKINYPPVEPGHYDPDGIDPSEWYYRHPTV